MFVPKKNEPLSLHTTYRIGGPARLFFEARSEEELLYAVDWAGREKVQTFILGKGSNVLFDDRVFDGLVIVPLLGSVSIEGLIVEAGAGVSFSYLGIKTARLGLSGLEFASGIPGSVGGAVFMNAGAMGAEVSGSLVSVDVIRGGGTITLLKSDARFAYRYSSFQDEGGIITKARFQLTRDPEAADRQKKYLAYRMRTQPYDKPSCGSVFRNPSGLFAAKLIETAGMKGRGVGGAVVSEKHANFILNTGTATAGDVLSLIALVREKVQEQSGILLDCEVQCISYDGQIRSPYSHHLF